MAGIVCAKALTKETTPKGSMVSIIKNFIKFKEAPCNKVDAHEGPHSINWNLVIVCLKWLISMQRS
jgi:hypothetical protein